MVLAWVADGTFAAAGIALLAYAWRHRPRPPAQRRRRPPQGDGFDRSVVIDGVTYPSATVAAVCAEPLPSDR